MLVGEAAVIQTRIATEVDESLRRIDKYLTTKPSTDSIENLKENLINLANLASSTHIGDETYQEDLMNYSMESYRLFERTKIECDDCSVGEHFWIINATSVNHYCFCRELILNNRKSLLSNMIKVGWSYLEYDTLTKLKKMHDEPVHSGREIDHPSVLQFSIHKVGHTYRIVIKKPTRHVGLGDVATVSKNSQGRQMTATRENGALRDYPTLFKNFDDLVKQVLNGDQPVSALPKSVYDNFPVLRENQRFLSDMINILNSTVVVLTSCGNVNEKPHFRRMLPRFITDFHFIQEEVFQKMMTDFGKLFSITQHNIFVSIISFFNKFVNHMDMLIDHYHARCDAFPFDDEMAQ